MAHQQITAEPTKPRDGFHHLPNGKLLAGPAANLPRAAAHLHCSFCLTHNCLALHSFLKPPNQGLAVIRPTVTQNYCIFLECQVNRLKKCFTYGISLCLLNTAILYRDQQFYQSFPMSARVGFSALTNDSRNRSWVVVNPDRIYLERASYPEVKGLALQDCFAT